MWFTSYRKNESIKLESTVYHNISVLLLFCVDHYSKWIRVELVFNRSICPVFSSNSSMLFSRGVSFRFRSQERGTRSGSGFPGTGIHSGFRVSRNSEPGASWGFSVLGNPKSGRISVPENPEATLNFLWKDSRRLFKHSLTLKNGWKWILEWVSGFWESGPTRILNS
jgi:hypothetical protein